MYVCAAPFEKKNKNKKQRTTQKPNQTQNNLAKSVAILICKKSLNCLNFVLCPTSKSKGTRYRDDLG